MSGTWLNSYLFTAGILSLIVTFITTQLLASRKQPHLPPGPPRVPLLGNLLNFPSENWVKTFTEWKSQYGDVVYASILGQPKIILNSRKALEDILIERAPRYQNRPEEIMGVELSGWTWNPAFKQPGPEHLHERKVLLSGLGPATVKQWYPKIEKATDEFMCLLAEDGDADILKALKNYVGKVILQVSYGEGVYQSHREELIKINVRALQLFDEIHSTFWFVDLFPFLKYVPSILPGTGFLKKAEESHKSASRMRNWPYELVSEESKAGTMHTSMTTQSLEDGHEPERVKNGVGVLYAAGMDTTYTLLLTFIQAMLFNPNVQAKAQREIDAFIQVEGRLPGFHDRSQLLYVEATLKECLRWNPPAPLGVVHANADEDVYKGMRIPKGATIFPNIWSAMYEEDTFPEPEKFRPERFLESPSLPDPGQFIFGFGRRICPGKHLADRIAYLTIIEILALFHIEVAPETTLPSKPEFDVAFFSTPKLPKTRLTLRNASLLPVH